MHAALDILQKSLETFREAPKPSKISHGSPCLRSLLLGFPFSLCLKSVSSNFYGFEGQGEWRNNRWLYYAIPLGAQNHANCWRHAQKLVGDLSGGFKTTKDQSWKLLLEKLSFTIYNFFVFKECLKHFAWFQGPRGPMVMLRHPPWPPKPCKLLETSFKTRWRWGVLKDHQRSVLEDLA